MSMILSIDGMADIAVDETTDFSLLLKSVNGNSSTFAILEKSDQNYIQTHCDGLEFVLEKREGGAHAHYSATNGKQPEIVSQPRKWWQFWGSSDQQSTFPLEVIVDQFSCYAFGRTPRSNVSWTKMDVN